MEKKLSSTLTYFKRVIEKFKNITIIVKITIRNAYSKSTKNK
jgi:hypothetical protein